jgi:DNA-binding NarL/FixJ family response regulator
MAEAQGRKIRVIVADDHPILRDGLAALIATAADMELVGEAKDGISVVECCADLKPDVLLLDLQMPRQDGLDALAGIRQASPATRVIVLTTYARDGLARRALKEGARGFLLKSTMRRELLDAIRAVDQGQFRIDPEVGGQIAELMDRDDLTSRELQVLDLIGRGLSNKLVAARLEIREDTVKGFVKGIFAKLGVQDRTEAVTVALRRGLLDIDRMRD